MLATRIVKNSNGEHFAFRLRDRSRLAKSLSPKSFRDEFSTLAFIRRLKVPNGHWRQLCQSIGSYGYDAWRNSHPWLSIEEYIAQCLIRGDIQVFRVKNSDGLRLTAAKRKFKDEKGVSFQFTPACQLLTTEPEIKQITSPEQIQRFLDTLKPSKEQLNDLVKSLELPGADADSTDVKSMTDKLTDSITKGEVVITVAEEPRKPEPAETLLEVVTKAVDLGPHETESEEKEEVKEEEPICKLQKLTVSCAHDGRKQVVTPKTAGILNLDVVASETSKRGFEIIKATVQTEAPCGTHTSSSSSISRTPAKTIKGSLENTYHLASAPISNPLKVLWLPSIKPTTYKIAARACETFSPSSIEVNVFPKVKWNAEVGYSFGGKEITSDVKPGEKKRENAHTDKTGKFYGKVEYYYDEIKQDLALEYKNGIDKVLKKLNMVQRKVDSLLMKLGDSTEKTSAPNVKLEVFWPSLSIKYEAELLEDKKSPEVVSSYDLKVSADPLIGMKGSVDVFPMLLKAVRNAGGVAAPIAVILEAAMKGVGNDKSVASLQADIQLVFSVGVKTAINFSTKGRNGKDNADCKAEQSIAMDLQFEGLVGAKGHVWIIKYEKNYKMGVKTGFVGKIIIDRDSVGYYWYCQFVFNGITIYFTSYEKLEKTVSVEDDMFDLMAPDQAEESTTKEFTWFESEIDEDTKGPPSPSNKHYLIKF